MEIASDARRLLEKFILTKVIPQNPLVNAMAVGIVKHDEIVRAVAKGKGNPVLIVGSSSGRDGIHGATFASEEIS